MVRRYWYQDQIYEDQSPNIKLVENRAFLYGDGLFESIKVRVPEVHFFDLHWHRLVKGAQILGYILPEKGIVFNGILKLIADLEINQIVSARLMIFRTGGGKYTPQGNAVDWLWEIVMQPHTRSEEIYHCGNSSIIYKPLQPWSGIKSMNALLYVMAAKEMQEMGWQEMILCNTDFQVCEGVSSNIIWETKQGWFTPAKSCGAIEGVCLGALMQKFPEIHEVTCTLEALKKAERIIFCNSIQGIRPARYFLGRKLNSNVPDAWQSFIQSGGYPPPPALQIVVPE